MWVAPAPRSFSAEGDAVFWAEAWAGNAPAWGLPAAQAEGAPEDRLEPGRTAAVVNSHVSLKLLYSVFDASAVRQSDGSLAGGSLAWIPTHSFVGRVSAKRLRTPRALRPWHG